MFRALAIATIALSAVVGLSEEAAAAGSCDNLEGQDVVLEGPVDKVLDTGVIFFTDKKTGCEFGLVTFRSDPTCKAGGPIRVKGKLRKNAYLEGTYDVERNRKAAGSLVCP
jgi:hypothetical protein